MIQFDNLSYRYKRGPLALDNLNAAIGPGIHLLLGENGAGKTTLLHIIGGLRMAIPAHSCTIDGEATALRNPSVLEKTFVLTDEMMFPYGNINQMVRHHAHFYPRFNAEMLRANLDSFGMTGLEPIDHFSLGNRKKAQLAYVLALRPEVLLLDEPANGLDISARHTLLQMLARCVGEDQTVIISTHTVWDFQNLFDGVMMLRQGQLVMCDSLWNISSKIAFVGGSEPIDGAIYMQQSIGHYEAIVPNPDGSLQTNIDFVLLYNALQSDKASQILSIINS